MKFLLLFLGLTGLSLASEQLKLAADNPTVLRALFSQFQKDNLRVYSSPEEARLRLSLFRNFVKEAAKVEDEEDDLTLGVTFFADLTEDEKLNYYGANMTEQVGDHEEDEFVPDLTQKLQATRSWKRYYGIAKAQSNCGSCWAFGAVGVTEGFQSIANRGRYTALSEQQVLDCSRAGDCPNGGYHRKALEWIRSRNSLTTSSRYRYTGRQGRCRSGQSDYLSIRVTSVKKVYGGDRGLAAAISKGPVAVRLENFHGYGVEAYLGGVIAPSRAPSAPTAHIVTAVGYTDSNWELRNSWGTGWGQRGYFWHSRRRNNNIGISDWPYTITYSSSGQEEE